MTKEEIESVLADLALHQEMVEAGIAFLTDEQLRRLVKTVECPNDPREYVDRVTQFLLREVGAVKLREQWEQWKALNEANHEPR